MIETAEKMQNRHKMKTALKNELLSVSLSAIRIYVCGVGAQGGQATRSMLVNCKSACNNDPLLSKSAWKIDPPQQSLYSVDFIRQIGGTGDAYSGDHQKDTFSLISRQKVHTPDCKRVQFIQKYRP